jgi:hypothetical protein
LFFAAPEVNVLSDVFEISKMAAYSPHFFAAVLRMVVTVFAEMEYALAALDDDKDCLKCREGVEQFSKGPMVITYRR